MSAEQPTGDAAGLRAVILAGGKGRRLQPFAASFPKPLVPLGDTPVIEALIRCQNSLHHPCLPDDDVFMG